MHSRLLVLVALAAAVALTSGASAGPTAARQRIAIDATILPQGTFVLTPLQSGTLKRDSGTVNGNWQSTPEHDVIRDGQKVAIFDRPVIWKLTGKRGTLTIQERSEWADVGSDVNSDAFPDSVGFGTWKVVRGTGAYAGITGGGRSAHMGLGNKWFARSEGVLLAPS